MFRAVIAALACVIATACGGGGASSSTAPATMGPYKVRQVVYYGGCVSSIPEVAKHVNTWWATGWCGPSNTWHVDVVNELLNARTAGIDNVVIQLKDDFWSNPTETAFQLGRVDASGILNQFASVGVAALDEPNNPDTSHGEKTDAEVTAKNAELRALFATLPTFSHALIVNLYACGHRGRPGMTTSDVIGCDDYNAGCGVTAAWDDLYRAMTPSQWFMTLTGGSSPWKQDPDCVIRWASVRPRVLMHVWFRREDSVDHGVTLKGIASNGMAPVYCAASADALQRPRICQ